MSATSIYIGLPKQLSLLMVKVDLNPDAVDWIERLWPVAILIIMILGIFFIIHTIRRLMYVIQFSLTDWPARPGQFMGAIFTGLCMVNANPVINHFLSIIMSILE